jgi:DNA-binding GntR family transcriptional regulator
MASRGTISPAEINALNAARRREENEGIARLAAQQRDWQAREARAAQEELRRRRGGGH